jgi:hypothetical protein
MPGQACGTSLLGSALRPRKNDQAVPPFPPDVALYFKSQTCSPGKNLLTRAKVQAHILQAAIDWDDKRAFALQCPLKFDRHSSPEFRL